MSLTDTLTIAIAVSSLVISLLTAWLTLIRSGKILMTRPNIIGFAYDGTTPKITLHFLLYCSAQRGNVVESIYLVFAQGERRKIYSFWGYYGTSGKLVGGSGLFVSREGIATMHHFVLPKHDAITPVEKGSCTINLYATVVGQAKDRLLHSVQLNIGEREANAINNRDGGILYNWHPDTKQYHPENP